MRVYVDELPKTEEECPFYRRENDICSICNKMCHVDNCGCLIPFTIIVSDGKVDEDDTIN